MNRFLFWVLLLAAGAAQAQSLADSGQVLPGVWAGHAAWGDYDGDGDADLALIGETTENGQATRIARIFRYDEVGLTEDESQRQRLTGVYFGEVAWVDYDHDGDLDLSIAGWDEAGEESLRLYLNEAGDSPTERRLSLDLRQTALEGVRYAALSWADYDGDGDADLAVAGMDHSGVSLTQLYRNEDGVLLVDAANSEAVVNVHNGVLAWADYDGDGDLDLSIAGENVTTTGGLGPVTEFYKNDPAGTLNLDPAIAVENKVKGGGLAWADYDGDGNLDLAVSGRDGAWNAVLSVYRNRPTGVLTLDESFTLNTSRRLSARLAWVDYDNDGDLDLAASGTSILSDHKTLVFPNRSGSLSGAPTEEFAGLAGGAVAWADHDSDGRIDLLVSGADAAGISRTTLYSNLTATANALPEPPARLNSVEVSSDQAVFSWAPGSDAESSALTYDLRLGTEPGSGDIFSGTVAVGPGSVGAKTSFVLQRFLPPDTYYWSVRTVDGALGRSAWSQESQLVVQQFVSSEQRLRALKEAAMAWGDFDQDGDQDLAVQGQNRSGEAQTLVYENRAGTLAARQDLALIGLRNGDVAWGDYDRDGDLDLLVTGEDIFENRNTLLYRAVPGAEGYTLEAAGTLTKLAKSEADWGDFDNDGDLDLALMGQSDEIAGGRQQSLTLVFRNDGQGGFAAADFDLVGVNNGELAWADYDNDGDLDLALNGSDSEGVRQFRLYRNDGGELVDGGLSLPGLESSDLAWGDFDQDGDADLVAGGIGEGGVSTVLYENQGGQLVARADAALPGIQGGDLVWGDYDNDQDLDLVVAGNDGTSAFLAIYENTIGRTDTASPFVAAQLPLLQGVDFCAVSLADIDGDGDLDLFSTGRDASFAPSAAVNDNLAAQQFNANRAPAAPTGTAAQDSAGAVVLSWNAASDDGDPPVASLGYHLRVGTVSGQGEVLSGSSAMTVANAGQALSHRLQGLASGTYYWSVQAVDAGFAHSEWTPPESFVIDTVAPQVSGLRLGRRQAGIGQSVSLVLNFADQHSGVDPAQIPVVSAVLGGQEFPFQTVQFTGETWSGELTLTAQMPSGAAAIAVRGVQDRKQNQLVPFDTSGVFVADTEVPLLVGSVPADAATGVGIGSGEVVLSFSEPMDEGLLSADHFEAELDNQHLALIAAPAYDPQTRTVHLLLGEGLAPGSQYRVEVSAALQDSAGNRLANALLLSFSTQVPQLQSTFPLAGDSLVTGNGQISALFDLPLHADLLTGPEVVHVLREGAEVELEPPRFDLARNELSTAIAAGLRPGSRYEVVLSRALAGSLQATDFSWSFRTPVPQMLGTVPAAGDTAVKAGTRELAVSFTHALDVLLIDEENVEVLRAGQPVRVAELLYADEELRIVLDQPIEAGTAYQVRLAAVLGGPLRESDYQWSFSTAVPRLVEVSPVAGATAVDAGTLEEVVLSFDSPLDLAQVRAANFALQREGTPVPLRAGDPVVRGEGQYGLAPAAGWQVGSIYGVSIAPPALGPLGADRGVSWTFQTLVPDTLAVSPAAGAAVDPGAGVVSVLFDSGIETDELAAAVQVLREGQEAPLREAPRFDAATRTLSCELAEGFRPGSRYEVVVSRTVAGPRRGADFRWSFTTPVPQLAQALPAAGDTSVAPGLSELQVQFTGALDGAAIKPENAEVRASGQALSLTGLRYDGQVLHLELAQPLQAGTSYQVRLGAALGGPLRQDAGDYTWAFSTRIPTVERTLPTAGGAIPAGRRRLQVVFSSPLDLDQITPQNFRLSQGGEELTLERSEFQYDADTRTLSFPFVDFVAGSAYQAVVSSRVSGPLGAGQPDVQWLFSTELPTVTATVPAAGAEGVSTALPTLQVAFSGPVASQGAGFFQLRARSLAAADAAPEVVPITNPGADTSGTLISFAPQSGLRPFTEYEVVVDRQVLGELAAADYSFKFSTAPQLASPAQGGLVSNAAQTVELYFPPNALQGGTGEIAIRPWTATAAKPVVQAGGLVAVGPAYELDAGGAVLRKPATLSWRYTASQLGSGTAAHLGLFRLVGEQWQRVGGMVDPAAKQVRTAVTELGVYALFADPQTQVGGLAIEALDCQPRAFAPAGGNLRHQTDISFALTGPADVTVRVYNTSGRLERVILRDAPMAPGSISLSWDGKDEDHQVVASGLYIVVVSAGNARRDQVVAVVR